MRSKSSWIAILVLFFLIIPACAVATEYPTTLDGAVKKVIEMKKDGKTRDEIAQYITEVVDDRIHNKNSFERIFAHWKHLVPGELAGPSEKDINFNKWRKSGGAEADYITTAKWAWKNQYGQCAECAAVTYYILKKAGYKDVRIINRPDHRFVIWGIGKEDDPNNPNNYNNNVIVPDGWQGETLKGKEIIGNKYTSFQHKKLTDNTELYDRKAKELCGFVGKICCEIKEPCRGDSNLVCVKSVNKCTACGLLSQRCCFSSGIWKSSGDGICKKGECIDGYCREKEAIKTSKACGKLGQTCCECYTCDPGLTCLTKYDEEKHMYVGECIECGKNGQPPCYKCGGMSSLDCCAGKPDVKECEEGLMVCRDTDGENKCFNCGCFDQKACPGEQPCKSRNAHVSVGYCVSFDCLMTYACEDTCDCINQRCVEGYCRQICFTNKDCSSSEYCDPTYGVCMDRVMT
jgi:hypothetical protein